MNALLRAYRQGSRMLPLMLLASPILAQQSPEPMYKPSIVDGTRTHAIMRKFEREHDTLQLNLPAEHKKDYSEIYAQRWRHIKSRFQKKEIYTLPSAQQYLDSMLNRIVAGTPDLRREKLHAFFSRSGTPNATSVGQGIIFFNIGLFTRLDNEHQAAFILCHEIAHAVLKHSEKSIEKYVKNMHSSALQKELKELKKVQYNRLSKLEALSKGLTFDSRRHSRNNESDADSLALVYFRNCGFDPAAAVTAMQLLDKIDEEDIDMTKHLRTLFDAPQFRFQDRWLEKDAGLLGGHATLLRDRKVEDSLKTHPDCVERANKLIAFNLSADSALAGKPPVAAASIHPLRFDSLRKAFQFEIIEFSFAEDNYTESLYYTIAMLEKTPNDPYLIMHVARILNNCFYLQRQHRLGKKLRLPAPENRESFNTLAQFVQNLYMEEYAQIAFHYLQRYQGQLSAYPEFQSEFAKSEGFIKM
ncbi:M48 family metallopeptidase [Chitinophaga deserti]|uniref:M48 family metallopeptidase n=1 Tax=Chitinophaga deserti TaxID=2164099 RepID=UPI000D6C8D73|nr:M48 family metallopeptidase [Chitinophaga deserti]